MNKKKILAILGVMLVITMLFGCGKTDNGVEDKPNVGVEKNDDKSKESETDLDTLEFAYKTKEDVDKLFEENEESIGLHKKLNEDIYYNSVDLELLKGYVEKHKDLINSATDTTEKGSLMYKLACLDDLEQYSTVDTLKDVGNYLIEQFETGKDIENINEFNYIANFYTRAINRNQQYYEFSNLASTFKEYGLALDKILNGSGAEEIEEGEQLLTMFKETIEKDSNLERYKELLNK